MLAKLLALLIIVPLLDLGAILFTSHYIGLGWTIASMVACAIVGALLVRRESMSAWRTLRLELAQGRVPERPLLDGVLVLLSGALLLTPGPLTDAAGLLLLTPPVRKFVRGFIRRRAEILLLEGASKAATRVFVER